MRFARSLLPRRVLRIRIGWDWRISTCEPDYPDSRSGFALTRAGARAAALWGQLELEAAALRRNDAIDNLA